MRMSERAEAGLGPELEPEAFHQLGESQASVATDSEWAASPFTEYEEAELATGLLETGNARQLDQFLGALIQKATRSLGGVGNTRLGRVLGGMLKSLARDAIPGHASRPTGMSPFAPERESFDFEEREFEAARRFVRFAGAAARQAARSPAAAAPARAARSALRAAAQRHAPQLLRRRRRLPRTVFHAGLEQPAPACDEPSIHECRCDCPHHRGRKVVVINL